MFPDGAWRVKVIDKIEDAIVADVVEEGSAWIWRRRSEGGGWTIYPEASVRELYSNMSRMDRGDVIEEAAGGDVGDAGEIEMRDRWISVKRELGVCADEDGLTPAYVGIKGDKQALVLAAILAASVRDSKDAVLPARIDNSRAAWHAPAGLEFFARRLPCLADVKPCARELGVLCGFRVLLGFG